MALKIDKVQLRFELDQDKTLAGIKSAKEALDAEEKSLKKLKKGSEEYKAQEKVVEAAYHKYQQLNSEIKVSDMPMQMLVRRQKELNSAISQMRPSDKNYKLYRDELTATKKRIVELKTEAASAGDSLKKMATGFNRYAASILTTAYAIDNVKDKAQRLNPCCNGSDSPSHIKYDLRNLRITKS